MLASPDHFARNMLDVLADFPNHMARHQHRSINRRNPADVKTLTHYKRIYADIISRPVSHRQCLHELFAQAGQWLVEHDYPLVKPVANGIGTFALFFAVGDKGIRYEGRDVRRITHDLMLPADRKIFHPQLAATAEILPLVDVTQTTQQDVHGLIDTARKAGFLYTDPKPENQAPFWRADWPKPRHVVVDPGAAIMFRPS